MTETYEQRNFELGETLGLSKVEVIGLTNDLAETFEIRYHDLHKLDRFVEVADGSYAMLPMIESKSNQGFFLMQIMELLAEGSYLEIGLDKSSEVHQYTIVVTSMNDEVFEYTHASFDLVLLETMKHIKKE